MRILSSTEVFCVSRCRCGSPALSLNLGRAKERQLVWNNPRFPNTTYDTEDMAISHTEFRILKLVDPQSGELICELEHEIRAASHPSFCAKQWVGPKFLGELGEQGK